MSPKELIDKAIAPLASLLKEAGFRKLGRRFYRDIDESRIFLEVQASQWNREGYGTSFTINLGLFVPDVLRKLGRDVIDRPKSIHQCTWNERIGVVTPSRCDLWWKIDDEKSVPEVSANLLEVVRESALPWLESAVSYEGFCSALASSKGIGPANMLWELGRKEEAIACIKRVTDANPGQYKVLEEWLESHVTLP